MGSDAMKKISFVKLYITSLEPSDWLFKNVQSIGRLKKLA